MPSSTILLEKAMAPHSSVLAWRIPGMGEPGGLPSMGSHRVEHDWSDLVAAAQLFMGFPHSSFGKESACYAGGPGSIPGSGRCPRRDRPPTPVFLGFPCGSADKEFACSAGHLGSMPGLWKSLGEGRGNPLQYSVLENSMDCVVCGVAKTDWATSLSQLFIPLHSVVTENGHTVAALHGALFAPSNFLVISYWNRMDFWYCVWFRCIGTRFSYT